MKLTQKTHNTIFVSLLIFFVLLPAIVFLWVSNFSQPKDIEVFLAEPIEVKAQIVSDQGPTATNTSVPVSLKLVSNGEVNIVSTFLTVLVPKDLQVTELVENSSLGNILPSLAGDPEKGISIKSHNESYNKIQLSFLNTTGVKLAANQPITFASFNVTSANAGTYPISFDTNAELAVTDKSQDYLVPPTNADTKNIVFSDQGSTTSTNPLGYLDKVDAPDIVATGWACDPDSFNTPIEVNLYADKERGQTGSVFLGSYVAQDTRNDLLASQNNLLTEDMCGGTTNHGYTIYLNQISINKAHLMDGFEHKIFVYATNVDAGGQTSEQYQNPLLPVSVGPDIFTYDNIGNPEDYTASIQGKLDEFTTGTTLSFSIRQKDSNSGSGETEASLGVTLPTSSGSVSFDTGDVLKSGVDYVITAEIPNGYEAYYSGCLNCNIHIPQEYSKYTSPITVRTPSTKAQSPGLSSDRYIDFSWKLVPATSSNLDLSNARDFSTTLRLDKRDGSAAGHKHPNVFVGVWRDSEKKMLVQANTASLANGSVRLNGFFSQNGTSYNLLPSDTIIVKPEGYLAKGFKLSEKANISPDKTNLHVEDLVNYYIGGDLIIDIGTFDVVNVRDYVLMRNYYGSEDQQKYDRYFLDFNGNGFVDIRDFGVYAKNHGKKGVTESLDRSIIDSIIDSISSTLYQVILK